MREPPPRTSSDSFVASAGAHRVSILAVDDQPANLVAIESIVDPLGHELVAVGTGLEALNAASTREFAAIVLDVAMPGLDGFETLRRLREIPSAQGTPVILMTAHRFDPAMVRRAFSLGAVDYLEKPVSAELLSGKLASFVALFRQRKEITRQHELLRLKDRHMGILAHDLRAPVSTALETARQLLRHEDLHVRIAAERIARTTEHVQQLVHDLLASARAATAIRLRPQRLELSALVEELVDDFRATYADIRFTSALACNLHGTWDPARLRQALSNLLANAVKYGEGVVLVETRGGPQEATVILENGGRMMSPQQLTQLRDARGRDAEREGAGLGLSVAKEIAVAHGGDLRAESQANRTRFTLTLPLATAGTAPPDVELKKGPSLAR
jgi:two-component system sensor histidine kinase/response regulator